MRARAHFNPLLSQPTPPPSSPLPTHAHCRPLKYGRHVQMVSVPFVLSRALHLVAQSGGYVGGLGWVGGWVGECLLACAHLSQRSHNPNTAALFAVTITAPSAQSQ
jgi:hypothetical protein